MPPFFVLLFSFFFFLQLGKFSIMTFSASASVMPSVPEFQQISLVIDPSDRRLVDSAASTCCLDRRNRSDLGVILMIESHWFIVLAFGWKTWEELPFPTEREIICAEETAVHA